MFQGEEGECSPQSRLCTVMTGFAWGFSHSHLNTKCDLSYPQCRQLTVHGALCPAPQLLPGSRGTWAHFQVESVTQKPKVCPSGTRLPPSLDTPCLSPWTELPSSHLAGHRTRGKMPPGALNSAKLL